MNIKPLAATLAILAATPLTAAPPAKAQPAAAAKAPAAAASSDMKTDDEKTLYALGLLMSRNIEGLRLTEQELELVKAGIMDGVHKTGKLPLDTWGPKVQAYAVGRIGANEKKVGDAYLAKAATEKGAQKKASGLIYTELKAGTGPSPKVTDTVKVTYKGTMTDGTEFDSSAKHGGQPITFPLNGVIKCWGEGVALMKVGGKARLVCPSAIAYGDNPPGPPIKPGSTLIFEVDLVGIEPEGAAKPPAAK